MRKVGGGRGGGGDGGGGMMTSDARTNDMGKFVYNSVGHFAKHRKQTQRRRYEVQLVFTSKFRTTTKSFLQRIGLDEKAFEQVCFVAVGSLKGVQGIKAT